MVITQSYTTMHGQSIIKIGVLYLYCLQTWVHLKLWIFRNFMHCKTYLWTPMDFFFFKFLFKASLPHFSGARCCVTLLGTTVVKCVWNVMAHEQKSNFIFRRNERVHLNRRGRQFSRLLAAEVCAAAVVILDTPCSEVVWRVLATHSIRQFPFHFPSRTSPCAITFQLNSNTVRSGTHRRCCGLWYKGTKTVPFRGIEPQADGQRSATAQCMLLN